MPVTVDLKRNGVRFMAGTVTLDATNPTPVDLSEYMSTVLCGVASISGSSAPADDPNLVTQQCAAGVLNIYAWKHVDTGTDPSLVASTDGTRVVDWFALGIDVPRKGPN